MIKMAKETKLSVLDKKSEFIKVSITILPN